MKILTSANDSIIDTGFVIQWESELTIEAFKNHSSILNFEDRKIVEIAWVMVANRDILIVDETTSTFLEGLTALLIYVMFYITIQ